jgi:23S rRNA (pseudouridine1915-N3)-methyltransferase
MGKLKKDGMSETHDFFISRIRHMAEIEETHLKKDPTEKDFKNSGPLIVLDEKGKEFCSTDFSKFLEKKFESSKSVSFFIGGAYGIPETVQNLPHQKVSLSKLTFSHELCHLVFLEQIYRALTIMTGHPYHHE